MTLGFVYLLERNYDTRPDLFRCMTYDIRRQVVQRAKFIVGAPKTPCRTLRVFLGAIWEFFEGWASLGAVLVFLLPQRTAIIVRASGSVPLFINISICLIF